MEKENNKVPTFHLFDELRVFMPGILSQVHRAPHIWGSLEFLWDNTEIVTDLLRQVDGSDQVLQSLRVLRDLIEVVLRVGSDKDGEIQVFDRFHVFFQLIEVILGFADIIDWACQ